jgi:hypothetical protein
MFIGSNRYEWHGMAIVGRHSLAAGFLSVDIVSATRRIALSIEFAPKVLRQPSVAFGVGRSFDTPCSSASSTKLSPPVARQELGARNFLP